MDKAAKLQQLAEISTGVVYIAGSAFVAGSACTLLLLVILDFMRRNTEKRKTPSENFPRK